VDVHLFISAASSEFEPYREGLRDALARTNVHVRIQEDFKAHGETTLVKLDDYIKTCDAVIHLAGDACGSSAGPPHVQALADRYANLADKVPGLARNLGPDATPLSYTQWEAWLALYHGKRLFVARPHADAPRSPNHVPDAGEAQRQRAHLQHLRTAAGIHAEIEFHSLDNLTAQLFASPILDMLLRARLAELLAGDEVKTEFLKQEKRSRLPVPLFQYLWRELGSRPDLLGRLAAAARDGDQAVAELAASLAAQDADAAESDLLRDAWRRIRQVRAWETRAATLQLPLIRWQGLAALVAATDAREPPPFSNLLSLLLWSMDLSVQGRDRAALTQLLWLAAQASRLEGPAGQRRADVLVEAIEADEALQPHLAPARNGPALPTGPVRVHVELELDGDRPRLANCWVQEQRGVLAPAGELPAGASLGEQLESLAKAVQKRGERDIHVEMMAPLILLCGKRDWTSYGNAFGKFAGLQDKIRRRNFCEDWAVSWRWRERLENEPEARPAEWQDRGRKVAIHASQSAHLVCRFDDEPAAEAPAHLVALTYVPPAPKATDRNLDAFFDALLEGHPYMLWPGDECAAGEFKAAVQGHVGGKRVSELPESLRRARSSGPLKHAVLFVDEPDCNPYELLGRFATSDASPPR